MSRCFIILATVIASLGLSVAQSEANDIDSSPDKPEVVLVPVNGAIAKPTLYILRRGIKEAIDRGADTLILDMKTPGGSVAVTLEIMEALDRFEGRTITYVNDEAMSAGAIIASVTDEIYFSPTAVIGAAEMIMGTGQDVPEGLKRKMNSYLSAKIRVFSGEQPMRAEVIRAMMDPEYELKLDDTVIKKTGELLTLTADEAMKPYGEPPSPLLGRGISASLNELLDSIHGSGNYTVSQLNVTWSETLAQYLNAITPVLLGLGLLALFVEFKTPGFGIFGVSGLLFLGLVFFGHHVAGLSGHEPALFFLLGVLLIFVEIFFFPGTLVSAIIGMILMLGSLVWAMLDLWPGESVQFDGDILLRPLTNLLLGVAIALVLFLLILRWMPRGGPWRGLILDTAIAGEPDSAPALHTNHDSAPSASDSLVGQMGTALTALFPSGQVEVGGKSYEAKLPMGFAEPGTRVVVTGVSEFHLNVEVNS
ncbi:MAG: NfeD family protein [Luteolibacter sp.]